MVEIDESFKIFQQFRMNNGDSSTGQENEVVDIEKTRTAAGEGSVENERHAGLRNRVIKDAFGVRRTSLPVVFTGGRLFIRKVRTRPWTGLFWRAGRTRVTNFVIL